MCVRSIFTENLLTQVFQPESGILFKSIFSFLLHPVESFDIFDMLFKNKKKDDLFQAFYNADSNGDIEQPLPRLEKTGTDEENAVDNSSSLRRIGMETARFSVPDNSQSQL